MSNLYIPKTIRVGFQDRKGTYTGKLAYVIYYDDKGKLRKEKSWSSWRDEKIEPVELSNEPQDGFVLNKGIQRYNWGHFGSNRSMIRVYDSRDIEFEITPENLIGILTETDCLKRGLDGKFVYAWQGTELVLLPCNSEEYQKAVTFTERQSKKLSLRDLKPGCSYTTKKGEEVIYVGRFQWFKWDTYSKKSRVAQKKHIFYYVEKPRYGDQFFPKGEANFLAEENSPDPVQNFPAIMDKWNKDIRSSVVVEFKKKKPKFKASAIFSQKKDQWGRHTLGQSSFTEMDDNGIVTFYTLHQYARNGYGRGSDTVHTYELHADGTLDTKTMTYSRLDGGYGYSFYHRERKGVSKEEIIKQLETLDHIDMKLESGKSIPLHNISDIAKG